MTARREEDPIIRFALANMRQAQPLARRAANALRVAARALRQHPDFRRSMAASAAGKSAKDRVTLPWYLYDCINSVLDDMPFAEGAGCIADDLSDPRGGMQEFIDTEEKDLARFARKAAQRSRRLAA